MVYLRYAVLRQDGEAYRPCSSIHLNLRGGDVGSTLTVNGGYVGMNGTLKFTAQQHSPGVADKLVINGGTTTASTLLDIYVSQLGNR